MNHCVYLLGPTASGKTEYAIELALRLGGEIVSADSMQIYKYMDIGSAKPSAEELAKVRHWLVDFADPKEPFSVNTYKSLAEEALADIYSRGLLPIVCGGTGLYVSALLYDMDFSAPEGSQEYRDRIFAECGGDPERLHDRLRSLDPKAADEIHKNNVKRVLRAVERLEKGEKTLAGYREATEGRIRPGSILIGLERDREELYDRIDRRVDALMQKGLPEEVERLSAMGLTPDDVSMKGIGYKEIMEAGGDLEKAAEAIKLNTRHYARRQMTWLRRYKDMRWFRLAGDRLEPGIIEEMLDYIRSVAGEGR